MSSRLKLVVLGALVFAISAIFIEFVPGPAQTIGIVGLYVFIVGGVFVIASREFLAADEPEGEASAEDAPADE